jgi:hypothetical protein
MKQGETSQLILPGWTPLIGWPQNSAQLLQFLLESKRRPAPREDEP